METVTKKLIEIPVSSLKEYGNNPRKNEEAVSVVSESIKQTGYNNPIIVDENNVILAGHTRLKSLKKLKIDKVQVLQVCGLTDEQKRKFRLLDNKTSEYAEWDSFALTTELQGLDWGDLHLDWGTEYERYSADDEEPTDTTSKGDSKQQYDCPKCGYIFWA